MEGGGQDPCRGLGLRETLRAALLGTICSRVETQESRNRLGFTFNVCASSCETLCLSFPLFQSGCVMCIRDGLDTCA